MRSWTSIWMLAARAQGPWALLAGLASAALTAGAFALAPAGGGLEARVAGSAGALAAGLGLVGLSAALALPLSNLFGTNPGLTLRRLRVSVRTAVLLIAVFDAACFFLFWAAHAVALFLLAGGAGPAASGLAFLREGFLHSLLPVADPPRLARNLLLCLALGIAAARFSDVQRNGGKPVALGILLCVTIVFFPQEMGSWETDLCIGILALLVAATQIYALCVPPEEGGEAA